MAERHAAGVLMVMHMNKSGGTKALYRGNGTLAFLAAARIAWQVTRDPDDRDRRLMTNIKTNIGPRPSGLAYRIREGALQWPSSPWT